MLVGFKINNLNTKMLTKNMKLEDQIKLMEKISFQIEKKIKYLSINMKNMNYMSFQK